MRGDPVPEEASADPPLPDAAGDAKAGLRALASDPRLFLWALFLVLFPLYSFDSGLPQPADLIMALLLGWIALDPRTSLPPGARVVLAPLFFFVLYSLIVNVSWALANHNFSFSPREGHIIFSVFYVFNAGAFTVGLALFRAFGDSFLSATAVALIGSVLLQTLGSFVVGHGDDFRQTLWFNNPNQLGYYAILCATLFSILVTRVRLSSPVQGVFFAATAYLAVLSLSKASMFAVVILAAVTLISRMKVLLVSALLLVGANAVVFEEAEHRDRVEHRVTTNAGDDNLAARGYDRIVNHMEYWFVGAGEGGKGRFDSVFPGELHSTFGTIAFSYGVPGTILFGLFLFGALRRADAKTLLLLTPAFFYGLTHNGLRFTLAWIMLSVLASIHFRKAP